MPETVSRGSSSTDTFTTTASRATASHSSGPHASSPHSSGRGTAAGGTSVPAPAARPQRFRGRIGVGLAGGFYPAPHRFQLYLSEACPYSGRVAVVLDLLGLTGSLTTTVLKLPAETPEAFASLRGAYEATWHHYDGPLTAPALCDRWSGRVVSNHAPDILRDLAGLLADGACESALDRLDRQLARHPYVLGADLSTADKDLWVTLTHLDHFDAAGTLAAYRHIEEYVRRLGDHPDLSADER
ncbi:glutathione S-transferase C-terminal domain-containing protein [Streptomyces phaeochromogenes]|uniref:glutathione S-transferase C-terminal domain-containing protein n=1 Tax=Streptomyces phaeochromogenes TaxID=1923 RepID=UPI00386C7BE4|nr:cell envelope biogenesis protein OmpA [Streptomyces phaeochromogenes]